MKKVRGFLRGGGVRYAEPRLRAGRFRMSTSTSFSLLLTLALVLPGAAALGAETEPAGGTPVPLVIAVADAPSLAAARARAQAAGERLGAAGRFPAPQIEGMFSTTSTPGDDMTMWEVA